VEYLEALARWEELSASIRHLQAEERALREALFAGTFPDPKEGTNSYTLPDGRIVKGVYKLNRNLIEPELDKVLKKLGWKRADAPLRVHVSLELEKYRRLREPVRLVFDECLEIKPGLPTLSVVLPEGE
jgi:hypothetical protein